MFSKKLAISSALLALGSLAAIVLSALSIVVLTRLVSPKEYGLYTVFLTAASVFSPVVALRLDIAALSATSRRQLREIFLLGLVCLPIMAVVGAALALGAISWVLGESGDSYIVGLAIVGVLLASGLAQLAKNQAIWCGQISQTAGATSLDAVVRNGVHLLLAVSQFGGRALVWGDSIGKAVMAILLWPAYRLTVGRLRAVFSQAPTRLMRYRQFVFYGSPSSLLDSLASLMLIPLVASIYSASDAGIVGLAGRVLSLPAAILSASYGDLIQKHLTTVSLSDAATRRLAVFKLFGVAFAMALLATGPLAVIVYLSATSLFGDAWATINDVVPWLALQAVLAATMSPVSRWVFVVGAQRVKLGYDVLALTIPTAMFYCLSDKSVHFAVSGYVIGHFVCYAVYFRLILVAVARHDNSRNLLSDVTSRDVSQDKRQS